MGQNLDNATKKGRNSQQRTAPKPLTPLAPNACQHPGNPTQNPPVVTPWGFDFPSRHHNDINTLGLESLAGRLSEALFYTGTLFRATGSAFSAVPFLPANVGLTPVGVLTLSFANGNSAKFAYTVDGVAQTKSIVRQIFRTPGTVCQ